MTQKLQQAIQLARVGEKQKAQYLLTQTLQEEPENTQAWYFLSLLVDSEEKQAAYLQRVLALDPSHEKAQSRLDEVAAIATAAPEPEPLESDEDSFSLSWLDDEDTEEEDEWLVATAVATLAEADKPAKELTDWLQEEEEEEEEEDTEPEMARPLTDRLTLAADDEDGDEEKDESIYTLESLGNILEDEDEDEEPEPAPVVKVAAPEKSVAPTATPKANGQNSGLTAVLILLVFLAVLVGIVLVYLLVTM